MSEKIEVVSVERSEFFQNPKAKPYPQHMQYCAYCIHDSADRPSCCRRCKTTAKNSDGKTFDDFTEAELHCIERNSKE